MKKYIVITILLSCFVTTFISADITPEYAQVLEDIGIMSAIIDKTLAKAFPGEYKEPQFLFLGGVDKCQGFYLKDYGVIFIAGANFPVSKTVVDKEEKQVKFDDLWETTKRELKGYDYYVVANPVPAQSFDQSRVDRLKDELLRLIGDYANNIRQLRPDDTITIIIRGGNATSGGYAGLQSDILEKISLIRPALNPPPTKMLPKIPSITKIFQLKNTDATSIQKAVFGLCSPMGNIVVDDRVNSLIVSDQSENIDKISQAIAKLDAQADKNKQDANKYDDSLQKTQAKEPIATSTTEPAQVPKTPSQADILILPALLNSIPSTSVQKANPSIVTWNGETPLVVAEYGNPNGISFGSGIAPALGQNYGATQRVAQTTMIISVKKRDAMDLKDGKIKFEDFTKRAEIIQY